MGPLQTSLADELSAKTRSAAIKASDITAYTLPNGLKVLLFPDHSKPELTVNIVYKTGSKHERAGEYGMAHLLEHMLFKGTKQYPRIWQELEKRGARFNANTNSDRTSFYETLVASPENLEFALALEADRMQGASWTDEDLASEISVVKNEWEQSDNSSFQALLKEMLPVAYPDHAYGRETLGVRLGLAATKSEDLRRFYQRRYGPNRAILAIGGNFSLHEAKALVDSYFTKLPPTSESSDEALNVMSAQRSERQVILRHAGDTVYVGLLYHTVPGSASEFVPTQALIHSLSHGAKGLFQREMIKKRLASEVFGFVQQSVESGFIVIWARPAAGQDPQRLGLRLAELLEQPSLVKVTAQDLRRFQAENSQAWAELMQDPRSLTMQLAEYEVLGDWQLLWKEQDIAQRLEVEAVNQAARWFKPENRTLGILNKKVLSRPRHPT